MPLWGLTGGIAAGKSTVAAELAKHGAIVIDADQVVRELQLPGQPVFDAIVERFGDGVVAADGSLDRPALGQLIFGDASARADLNAIVHPAVYAETQRRIRDAFLADPDAIVVNDVPLMVEADRTRGWELIIVADAPAEQRIERLVSLRGMDEADARARVASQASDDERRAIADVLIDTSGSLEQTRSQVDALWSREVRKSGDAQ